MFVTRLMEIIYKFVYRKEESFLLSKIDSLARIADVKEFICSSGVSEVDLSMEDVNTLIDCLIFDGRMERIEVEGGIALRVLREDYLKL